MGKGRAEEVLEEALEVMIEVRSSTVEVYPDSLRALRELKEIGLKSAVITNISSADVARRAVKRVGIADLTDLLVASEDIGLRKPHPAIFEHTARTLGTSPSTILHVGDSVQHDVEGARLAGATPILLHRGGGARSAPGVKTIRSLDELTPILSG